MTAFIKQIYRKALPLHWRQSISEYRHRDRLEHERWCRENLPNVLSRYAALTTPTHDRESAKKLLKDNLRVIELEISAFCNRTCWFCPNSLIDRKQKIELPESVFLRCIDNLAEIEYEGVLNFHRFNETLADKELILKRLRQARSKLPKAKLGIFSNGDYLTRECGMEIYTSPQLLTLHGRQVFVAHGDNMKIDGQPLLKLLNSGFRSRTLKWLFSWGVHPDWALKFGHWWSGKSRKGHNDADAKARREGTGGGFDASLTEPLIAYAREYAAGHDVDHFVFGHMHFPRDFRDGALHVVNLGGWEKNPAYAVLDDRGEMTLKYLDA